MYRTLDEEIFLSPESIISGALDADITIIGADELDWDDLADDDALEADEHEGH